MTAYRVVRTGRRYLLTGLALLGALYVLGFIRLLACLELLP